MREPPTDPDGAEVLALVRTHWSSDVDRVERLGARRWQGLTGFRPTLFVTLDTPRSPATLEAAYAAAAELAFALDFVVAALPSHDLTWTVPVAGAALSVTPWIHGIVDPTHDVLDDVRMLARLHAAHPPAGLPRWTPLDLSDEPDRDLVAEHQRLVDLAAERPWVVTHGHPGTHSQVPTLVRTLLVDWGSARLAPRERDLLALVDDGHAELVDADRDMLELFDLERRLAALPSGPGRA